MLEFLDLNIKVEKGDSDAYAVSIIKSPSDKGRSTGQFIPPFSQEQLNEIQDRIAKAIWQTSPLELEELQEFGRTLFDALFHDIKDRYTASDAVARDQGKGLRIGLSLDPLLVNVPWEIMYDPGCHEFIALSARTPLVRYGELLRGQDPWGIEPPLRILVVLATPKDCSPLNPEQERKAIRSALQELEEQGVVEIDFLQGPDTLVQLRRRLRKGHYHILHFIGHARYDEKKQKGFLLMEDGNGEQDPVSGRELANILDGHPSMRLAVVNACKTAHTSPSNPRAGVVASIAEAQIPAVIGMQFEISDSTAVTLARELYQAIADNSSIDAAISAAREAIQHDSPIGWSTLVLYLRTTEEIVLSLPLCREAAHQEPSFPCYAETAQRYESPLYDRQPQLDTAWSLLCQEPQPGIWVTGSKGSGRTPFVVNLAQQCLQGERPPPRDCIYFRLKECVKPDLACEQLNDLIWKLFPSNQAKQILLVIDDFDALSAKTQQELLCLLNRHLKENWIPIVVSSPDCSPGDKQGEAWQLIRIEKLDRQSRIDFIRDYCRAQGLDADAVLDSIQAEVPELVDETHSPKQLVAALEKIKWHPDGLEEAVVTVRGLLDAQDPMAQSAAHASENLDKAHKQILKMLLLVKTSITTEMLAETLACSTEHLQSGLAELEQRSLVEAPQTDRYRIPSGKETEIAGQCQDIQDPFLSFTKVWQQYARDHGGSSPEHYEHLRTEHQNLTHVLDELWERARIQPAVNDDDVPSLDAFAELGCFDQELAIWQYHDLRDHLRDYLYYEGYWPDFESVAKRAYAGACALQNYGLAAWKAADVATVLSLAGRCTEDKLKEAERWVDRIEEAVNLLGDKGELPASAHRLRGIIAMRRCQYDKSHSQLQKARGCLKHTSHAHLHEPGLRDLLAKLEMRSHGASEQDSYEKARVHLQDGLALAQEHEQQGTIDVIQTHQAELLIWQGEWDKAQHVLETKLELPGKPKRKDIWAKGLRLLALVYQHKSAEESEQTERRKHLNKAIEHAELARDTLEDAQTSDRLLSICSSHLILSALHSQRYHLLGKKGEQEECARCRKHALEALSFRRDNYPMKPDPDGCYEVACLATLVGNYPEASLHLCTALKHAPGFYGRAQHDFRLEPLLKGKGRAVWEANCDQEGGTAT